MTITKQTILSEHGVHSSFIPHSSNGEILKAEEEDNQFVYLVLAGTVGYGALGKWSHRCINLKKNSW